MESMEYLQNNDRVISCHRPVHSNTSRKCNNQAEYVGDLPLQTRLNLMHALDHVEEKGDQKNWRNLAALLGFSNDEVQGFRQALFRMAGSPTDEMLTVWDYGCHTITELYHKLFEMKHARCMMLLKEFVDPSLHDLIKKVQGVQPADNNDLASSVHQGHAQIPPVGYVPGAGGQPPYTADRQKPSQGSMNTGAHQPHWPRPGQPQATQGSWNGGPDHQAGAPAVRNEGLTANINKDSSEKVIGLGSPFQGWGGGSEDSSANNKSGNRGELISGGINSGSGGIGVCQEIGEKERLQNYQDQSALSLTIHIPYEDIVKATNNFDHTYKLGEGAFGTVYHAVIKLIHYAVKQMKQNENMGFETNKIARADQMKELRALVTYRNPYIVSLCAFCFDGPSPCLVYEFMENGSLEDNLLCKAQRGPLDWRTRHRIAEGAALGINFLHKAQEKPLIHGDIKSANILLGKHMEPKIADFGLARFGPENGKTYCYLKTKNAHGTLPYLPEEFKRNFKLSTKVDVFSYGVEVKEPDYKIIIAFLVFPASINKIFPQVLMEIIAGERVSDTRREPNRLLTDIVKEVMELEKQPQDAIERIRDRRCPDWPWDIAWYLLDLAVKCTNSKFKQRPEIDEAVNTLRNIGAEMSIRDEMEKRKQEFPIQDTMRRSTEGFQNQYYTPQPQRYSPPSHETSARYQPPTGPGVVPVRRDLSIESNAAVMRPELVPNSRYELRYQQQPMQQSGVGYDQGRYPAPQGYGPPRQGYQQVGFRRHMSSETSDENNLFAEDKLDMSSSSSLLTSYDMSRMGDPSMCHPLLYQSQSSVPSSISYQHQQSNPYSPPVYDVRHPDPRQLYPSPYHTQTSQGYPQQGGSQFNNPLCSSMVGNIAPYQNPRYQTADSSYATQNPAVTSASESSQRRHESLTLQDHMRQLDISQLPTKPLGGPLQQDAPPKLPTDRPTQQPVFVSAENPRRQPEQNTDVIPGYKPGIKEKSFKPPLVAAISEESDEEATPLRTSLTTAEMHQYLAGKSREPSQQTEKMSESSARAASVAPREATKSDEASPLKSSLTTVQMRQFLPSKREPTEVSEGDSATDKLEKALVSAVLQLEMSSPKPAFATETSDPGPVNDDDCLCEQSDLQSSLTTQQMRQFLPGRREPSQETETIPGASKAAMDTEVLVTTVPLNQRSAEESERCYSAPPNMAAAVASRAGLATRREPEQMTEPLNGSH